MAVKSDAATADAGAPINSVGPELRGTFIAEDLPDTAADSSGDINKVDPGNTGRRVIGAGVNSSGGRLAVVANISAPT